jgi:hypothetical protein
MIRNGPPALAAVMLLTTAGPAMPQGVCEALWVERNEIYAENGLCFKTRRAIAFFGNAGCVYDDPEDVPLSGTERRRVAEIVRAERRNGCR